MALVTRAGKGSTITHEEMDANLTGLADGSLVTGSGLTGVLASNVTFTPSGTGATSTDLQSKVRSIEINAWDYMSAAQKADVAARTALVDVADAINKAIVAVQAAGGFEYKLPHGKLLIGSKITNPASVVGKGHSRGTTIVKGFNGDCFEVGSFGGLHDLDIDGNESNFTGRGVIITEGTNGNSGGRQNFSNVRISNMDSYCVEYTTDGVGFASKWVNCDFAVADNDVYCIKLPTDTSTGNRSFIGCNSPVDSLINMSGAANTIVNGCFSGRSSAGNLHCIGMSSTTVGAIITGNRLAGGGQTFTVDGANGSITGNVIAGNVTFAATLVTTKYFGNDSGSGTITDSAPGASGNNEIYYKRQIFTPTWTASGGATDIGAGSLSIAYSRNGEWCQFDFNLNGGADTDWASGFYTFTLPFTASRDETAAVLMNDSDTNFYVGAAKIIGGSANMRILSADTTNAFVGAAVPFTWATSDKLHVTGAFLIQ